MKKLLLILILTFNPQALVFADSNTGRGEIKLSSNVIDNWIRYIKGTTNKPYRFYVTIDGDGSYYIYCPHGRCAGVDTKKRLSECGNYYNKECKVFAIGRTVKWKNGINTGKGKASKFSSKMTRSEVIDQFTKLGLYGETELQTSEVKSKKEANITEQLQFLIKQYNDGVLTHEEFIQAKKKLLN